MIDFAKQAIYYQHAWDKMVINPSRLSLIDATAKRLLADKAKFQEASVLTHVPWHIIAVIKERESGVDPHFLGNIANGQSWARKTTLVPAGRGPFSSWLQAAYDALVNCPPHAAKWKDWTVGGQLVLLTEYNGEGYYFKGVPDPYIFSFTNQYSHGKYTGDHGYDPNAVDQEIGCAPIIARLKLLDPTISLLSTPGA